MTLKIIAENLKEENFSAPYIYQQLLKEFNGTPYKWGGNSLNGSDCSGSVCTALSYATQKFLRVTADELYRNVFTKPCKESALYTTEYNAKAVFFLDGTGKAVHIAGYCGNGFFMNVSSLESTKRGTFRTLEELKLMYSHLKIELRTLREDY